MELSRSTVPTVCFFDSGIGGLNLLNVCVRKLPRVDFAYFADNYNMPYGSLSAEELIKKVDTHFEKISYFNPAAAVIACNTVTAGCVRFLREKYRFPIVGIQPAIKPASAIGGECVVLATPSTASSGAVKELVAHYGHGRCEVLPCPDLAAYVEEHIFSLDEEEIFRLLPNVRADSVVLGCTHYIFVKKQIEKFYNCLVYDGIEGTANRLCSILEAAFPNSDIYGLSQNGRQSQNSVDRVVFCGGDRAKNSKVFSAFSDF